MMDIDDSQLNTPQKHWNYTIREWETGHYTNIVLSTLKENNIKSFIDVGANVGAVSYILLKNIPSIQKGFLFEPCKENFSFMFDKFKDESRITCLNCGIYYGKKHLMALNPEGGKHLGALTIIEHMHQNHVETNEIFQLFPFEFFNFGNIDFVKIDIECAEWNVLENSTFLKNIPFIEIELHRNYSFDFFQKYLPEHEIKWTGTSSWVKEPNHVFLVKK